MRICLFTGYDKSKLVRSILNLGHTIEAIVIPLQHKYRDHLEEFVELSKSLGVSVFEVARSDNFAGLPKPQTAEVLLSVGFPLILPKAVIGSYRYAVNIAPDIIATPPRQILALRSHRE